MGKSLFDYTKIHFFDKDGHEMMMKYNAGMLLTFPNGNMPKSYTEYAMVTTSPDTPDTYEKFADSVSLMKIRTGERYPISADSSSVNLTVTVNGNLLTDRSISGNPLIIKSYASSAGTQYSPEIDWDNLSTGERSSLLSDDSAIGIDLDSYAFPMLTFESKINFPKISTGLVETQRLYFLVDNPYNEDYENGCFSTVREMIDSSATDYTDDASAYIDRYQLFLFIDQRQQNNFRFFSLDGDDLVWSDRAFIDLRKGSIDDGYGNGYAVNVGFIGDDEGFYEQSMYVCILDTSTKTTDYPGDVYPIGEITMTAEAEGEDERYRTLLSNFGIPDPKNFDNVFRDTDRCEDSTDFVSINRHSKQMFLAYQDIFPYVGTYKALLNAMDLLGYDDIFFKEWYKEVGSETIEGGLVSYDMPMSSSLYTKSISNSALEERIHLKKLNWLSMMYAIDTETDGPTDKYGFPFTIHNKSYYSTDMVVKLIALRRWLEKYILGINCHIIDIGGEGIVFERYAMPKFGKYQQVLEYSNSKGIAPIVTKTSETLVDGSANITVGISTIDYNVTLEDLAGKRFIDFADGYIDGTDGNKFKLVPDDPEDSSQYIYCGKTIELNDNTNSFEIRAHGTLDSYRFGHVNASGFGTDYVSPESPDLIVDNNEIFFDPRQIAITSVPKNTAFTNLPIIQIKRGYIRRHANMMENNGIYAYAATIEPDTNADDNVGYTVHVVDYEGGAQDISTFAFKDVVTLIPPTYIDNGKGKSVTIRPCTADSSEEKTDITREWGDLHPYLKSNYKLIKPLNYVDTYGLRYTIDNVESIPCFMIMGYEDPNIFYETMDTDTQVHFPRLRTNVDNHENGYEYYLEILDGHMIFNDANNDRRISLNFNYDETTGQVTKTITSFQYSSVEPLYQYHTAEDEYSNRFTPGCDYSYFKAEYEADANEAVTLLDTKSINVVNAGKYEIDALLYDENNNVFAKKANSPVDVLTPDIDSSVYIPEATSGNNYETAGTHITTSELTNLITNMDSRCKYKYEPKYKINNIIDGMIMSYDSHKSHLVNRYDNTNATYAGISSISDRFDYAGTSQIDDKTSCYSFIRRSSHDGYIYCADIDDIHASVRRTTGGTPEKEPEDMILKFRDYTQTELEENESGNTAPTASYLIVFSHSSEEPVLAVPGEAMCVTNYNESKCYYDEFIFTPFDSNYTIEGKGINEVISEYTSLPTYSYYIIPTWIFNTNIEYHIGEKQINGSIDAYPFKGLLRKTDLSKILFKSNFNGTGDNYGQATFRIIGSEITQEDDSSVYRYYLENMSNPDHDYVSEKNDVTVCFTQSCGEYMNINTGVTSNADRTITLDRTQMNQEMFRHLNRNYSISLREFDTNNGIKYWSRFNASDLSGYYSYNVPAETSVRRMILAPNLSEAYNAGSNPLNILTYHRMTMKWDIYKRSGKSQRNLMIESFNNIVSLSSCEPGNYDIELVVYDDYGNKYKKYLNGAITMK